MSEQKVIQFSTIEQIINTIHIGNKDNFITDFKGRLDVVINATQMVKINLELGGTAEQKEQYKDCKNSELIGCTTMKWVDDGMHNISIQVSVKDEVPTSSPAGG